MTKPKSTNLATRGRDMPARMGVSMTVMGTVTAALLAFSGSAMADTESKVFNNPKMQNKLVDWCAEEGGSCGQSGGVEAFCQSKGYDDEAGFSSKNVDVPTIYPGSGKTCNPDDGDECRAITKVTCVREAKSEDGANDETADEGGGGGQGDINILNKLGGQVQGELSSVVFSDGSKLRVAVFARGMDDALWWQAGNGEGKWYGWASIGGQMKGSPSCTPHKGKVFCAVRGLDDGVWVTQWSGGKWSGFTNLGGKTKSSPAMVHGYGAVHALVRGLDGNLFDNAFVEDPETELSNWTGWNSTGMSINGAPTCIVSKADKIHCYYRNADGATHEMVDVLNGGPTKNLGGETAVRPGVLGQNAASNIRVLVKGMDDKLWVNRRSTSGKWGGFKQTEYTFSGQPVCVDSNAEGIGVWCFATGGDKSVFAQRLPAEAFSGQ
ncbi:MAG: hypothetical protein GYA66_10800 [Phyllobacteriaceae bacterium]|nr:hypothetical protein [Phyllobacteriaceae bacterium]